MSTRTKAQIKAVLLDRIAQLKAERAAAAQGVIAALAAGGHATRLSLDDAQAALQHLDAAPAVPSAAA